MTFAKYVFILYLLLNNQKIRDVVDTLTTKAVLILGRFTPERKPLLDALSDGLRARNYLPVLFDFDKPRSQTTMETISTLAHMVRFVVADLTDAKSALQELQGIVPSRPLLAIQPIQLASQHEPGMFDFFIMYPWVLPTASYESPDDLLASSYEPWSRCWRVEAQQDQTQQDGGHTLHEEQPLPSRGIRSLFTPRRSARACGSQKHEWAYTVLRSLHREASPQF